MGTDPTGTDLEQLWIKADGGWPAFPFHANIAYINGGHTQKINGLGQAT